MKLFQAISGFNGTSAAKWPFAGAAHALTKLTLGCFSKRRHFAQNAHTGLEPTVPFLDQNLWGGYSHPALTGLKSFLERDDVTTADRHSAALAMAGWHAAEGQCAKALDLLNGLGVAKAPGKSSTRLALLKAYCLGHLDRGQEARPIIEAALAKRPQDPALLLAMANTYVSASGSELPQESEARLKWINQAYLNSGLMPLIRLDDTLPIIAGNLRTARDATTDINDGATVTVIVPAYNAETEIEVTLEGLAEQTWRNLEIIVVNDFSSDGTRAKVAGCAARDPRIKLIDQPSNLGSYSARNRALHEATGAFVTVHDAGDWSHAQKIERQVRHLEQHPNIIANYSNWARCYRNLMFVGKFRHKDRIIDWNPSSLLFRRELLHHVGGWDQVRVSADAEFIRRARIASDREITSIPEKAPLAFGFHSQDSLTRHTVTHGRTITHGVRREYHEAANHWHKVAKREELRLPTEPQASRPFPAPGPILAIKQSEVKCDVLILAPFDEDETVGRLSDKMAQIARTGHTVAIFRWPIYGSDVTTPLNTVLRQMGQNGVIHVIAPGQSVRAETVIVPYVDIFRNAIDLFPTISCDEVRIVEADAPSSIAIANLQAMIKARHSRLTDAEAWTLLPPAQATQHELRPFDVPLRSGNLTEQRAPD